MSIISWGFSVDYFHQGIIITSYWHNAPLWEHLYNNIGLFFYSALSIIGFLFIIYKRKFNAILLALFGMMTLSIGFFSLISGKEVLNVRWWYFSQILLAPLVAVSLVVIYNSFNKRKIGKYFLVLFIGCLSFVMITSTLANMDNHIFSPNLGVTYGFKDSEMDAASFFSQQNVSISSDFDYAYNPSSSIFVNYYNLPLYKVKPFDQELYNGKFYKNDSIIIIRQQIVNNPFRLEAGIYKLNYDPNTVLSQNFDKIYDSKTVTAYI